MMTNVGVLDGVVRLLLGLTLLAWGYGEFGPALPHLLSWVVWLAGVAFTLTGLFRYSPLYVFLGTDSCALYSPEDRP